MYDHLNDEIVSLVKNRLGDEAEQVLAEMDSVVKLESVLPPLVDNGRTYGDWNLPTLNLFYMGDYRPSEALPVDIIHQMLKSSPVKFALEMKRSQVATVFRNSRSWKVHSPDGELEEVVTANLMKVLPKMALDFSFSSLAYGASFQELVWEYKNKYELGITDSKYQTNKKFIVAKIPNSVNPCTVSRILRDNEGHFNGFVQQPNYAASMEIIVPREAALIIPYEEKYRNLWGESLLKPMYPIWFWYEVVLRAMVKYMERTGTPVALVKAPSRAQIIKPGTKTKVDGITWGMEIASNVARSNAAVIPSDTDDQGKPLWDLSYLNSTERSQPFLDILELLTQMILRSAMIADRALTQSSGGTGSYAIGKQHQESTSLHNEIVLTQWIHYINTYFLPLYSLYNRGQNGPPIWLETQGLDPTDRDNLTALLGVSQSMPAFQDFGYRIDWESLLTVNNIPLASEEDAAAAKQKQADDNLAKQQDMLAVQAKFSTPSPTKQADGSLKANLPNKPAPDKQGDAQVKAEDQSESFFVGDDTVELMNPNHDARGRFSAGKGLAIGGAGLVAAGTISRVEGKALHYIVDRKVSKEARDAANNGKSLDEIRGQVLSTDIISATVRGKKFGVSYDHVNRAGTLYGNVGAKAQKTGLKMWGAGNVLHRIEKSYTPPKYKSESFKTKGKADTSQWPQAKQTAFKSMYRDLAKKYHPDINKSPDATARMQDINNFYAKGDFAGLEELFKKLENMMIDDNTLTDLTMIHGILSEFLSSEEQFLTFDTSGVDNLPPFVIEDGDMILDRDTADLINGAIEFIAENLDISLDDSGEEVIRLFNPFHSRADGRFTSGKGSGGGGGSLTGKSGEVLDNTKVQDLATKKSGLGTFVKTTGVVLGLGGIGLAAYALLKPKDNVVIGSGDSINDLVAKGIISKDDLAKINVTPDTPLTKEQVDLISQAASDDKKNADNSDVFAAIARDPNQKWVSTEDAVKSIQADMVKLGQPTPNINGIIQGAIGDAQLGSNGGYAMYNPLYNTITLPSNPGTIDKILNDPQSYERQAFIHEMMHSGQESMSSLDPLGSGGLDFLVNTDYLEGNNELMTKLYIKDKYGTYNKTSDGVYHKEVAAWSGLAEAGSKIYGMSPQEFVSQFHAEADNASKQNAMLNKVFPDEVPSGILGRTSSGTVTVGYVVPSSDELDTWLKKYYNIDSEKAYKDLLGQ